MSIGAAQRKQLLVIDDNHDDLLLLKLAARRASANIEFQIVTDGHAAIDYFDRERHGVRQGSRLPDLVLLDLHLPKRDGLEVLRSIRRAPELDGIKIFIWSGSENPAH